MKLACKKQFRKGRRNMREWVEEVSDTVLSKTQTIEKSEDPLDIFDGWKTPNIKGAQQSPVLKSTDPPLLRSTTPHGSLGPSTQPMSHQAVAYAMV